MNRKIVKQRVERYLLNEQKKRKAVLACGILRVVSRMEMKAESLLYLSNLKAIN